AGRALSSTICPRISPTSQAAGSQPLPPPTPTPMSPMSPPPVLILTPPPSPFPILLPPWETLSPPLGPPHFS
ncbi:hypothetical protein PENARI_c181G12214, partial [Penicillium arizonense]